MPSTASACVTARREQDRRSRSPAALRWAASEERAGPATVGSGEGDARCNRGAAGAGGEMAASAPASCRVWGLIVRAEGPGVDLKRLLEGAAGGGGVSGALEEAGQIAGGLRGAGIGASNSRWRRASPCSKRQRKAAGSGWADAAMASTIRSVGRKLETGY
jgi:hypothetical protein